MLRRSSYEHYRINQRIIERLELEPCTVSDTVTGSSVEPPYTKHTIIISGLSEHRIKRNKRIIDELEVRCAEVDEDLASMEDKRLAQILMMRYVCGDEWEDIAKEVDYHADNCRKAAKKYLDGLDDIETERRWKAPRKYTKHK